MMRALYTTAWCLLHTSALLSGAVQVSRLGEVLAERDELKVDPSAMHDICHQGA